MVDLQDNLRLESLIKTVLSETLDIAPDSMTLDTHLRDLGLDSIMMLNVTIELEDRLGSPSQIWRCRRTHASGISSP